MVTEKKRLKNKGRRPESQPKIPEAQDYFERTIVNGIEISVAYVDGYKCYTLWFPQTEEDLPDISGHKPRGKDQPEWFWEPYIQVTGNPEVAKDFFKKAVELAKTANSVYDVYREIYKLRYDADPAEEANE